MGFRVYRDYGLRECHCILCTPLDNPAFQKLLDLPYRLNPTPRELGMLQPRNMFTPSSVDLQKDGACCLGLSYDDLCAEQVATPLSLDSGSLGYLGLSVLKHEAALNPKGNTEHGNLGFKVHA